MEPVFEFIKHMVLVFQQKLPFISSKDSEKITLVISAGNELLNKKRADSMDIVEFLTVLLNQLQDKKDEHEALYNNIAHTIIQCQISAASNTDFPCEKLREISC